MYTSTLPFCFEDYVSYDYQSDFFLLKSHIPQKGHSIQILQKVEYILT